MPNIIHWLKMVATEYILSFFYINGKYSINYSILTSHTSNSYNYHLDFARKTNENINLWHENEVEG